ncbi:hypothetical protein ACJMK2_013612, partial [Sinanodonta woodiana]
MPFHAGNFKVFCLNCRALPLFDIDTTTKDTTITQIKAGLYIHERRLGKGPVPPPRRRRPLKKVMSFTPENEQANSGSEILQNKQNFVITGVIDPKTQQLLSVFQALSNGILDQINGTYRNPIKGETMNIPEAIQRGLIQADFRENLVNGDIVDTGFAPLKSTLETKTYPVAGVIDPKTGEWIGVKEAITSGIIDPKKGKYCNPVTGEEMSIMEAVKSGCLVADASLLDEITEEDGMYTFVDFADVSYEVHGVIDPSTGEELTLKRAIQDGIIDLTNSLYRNPHTGETVALADAIKQGYIKAKPVDPSTNPNSDSILTFKQLLIKKQRFMPGGMDILDDYDEYDAAQDSNRLLQEQLRLKHDVSLPLTRASPGKKVLSLEEAMSQGILNVGKNQIKLSCGEVVSIEEALKRKLVEPDATKAVLDVYQDSCIGKLMGEGKFDPETGLVNDPATGYTLSLQAAVGQRVINPQLVFLYDIPGNKVLSLSEATEKGIFNPETAKYKNPKTGEEMTLTEAYKHHLLDSQIDPDQIVENCDLLSQLEKVADTKMKCICSPCSEELLTLEEAVRAGILDLKNGDVTDPKTGEIITLSAAIKSGKIDSKSGALLLEALSKLSLQEAIRSGRVDPEDGCYVDPTTRKQLSIRDAIQQGLLNPSAVMLVDRDNDKITSLGALIAAGRFDPETGLYTDPNTGDEMTLVEAIDRELIEPRIVPERYVDSTSSLRVLIDSNKINPRTTHFVAPNGQKMSLRDALAHGVLTMNSQVKIDLETGDVCLASDEEIVRALLDIKKNSDWLHKVEEELAHQRRLSERAEKLRSQRESTQ